MLIQRVIHYEVEDGPFFYLAGPMTEVDDHNFHEFRRVEAKLTERTMRIVSPYDLKSQPAPSEGGNPPGSRTPEGLEMLRRDLNIVMDPYCQGIILLPGWEESFGAGVETFVGEAWGRTLYGYGELHDGTPTLTLIPSRQRAKERFLLDTATREFFVGLPPENRASGSLAARREALSLAPLSPIKTGRISMKDVN